MERDVAPNVHVRHGGGTSGLEGAHVSAGAAKVSDTEIDQEVNSTDASDMNPGR